MTQSTQPTSQSTPARSWEYQDGEPGMWHSRFRAYYLLAGPERSILGAYRAWLKEEGKARASKRKQAPKSPPRAWTDQSRAWNWESRARAFDRYEERHDIDHYRAERAAFRARQVEAGQELQRIGLAELRDIVTSDEREMPAHVALRAVVDGIKTEQAGLGIPDYLIAIAEMSEDELTDTYETLKSVTTADDPSDEGADDRLE